MLPTQYQDYIHISRYARWLAKEKRREAYLETIARYCHFMSVVIDPTAKTVHPVIEDIAGAIADQRVMPSMRAFMTAGKALARDHIAGYNCSYTPIEDPKDFDEILYILMCGTGVGFSVERQHVNKLPTVPDELHKTDTVILVRDSKLGWAGALRELISLLYAGHVPSWDTSRVRGAGARLKTMGGRSSGPEPLEDLFNFVVQIFHNARGRKLTSLECHDIACKIGDIVVVGGVRRSAMLSLSNLSDQRMRDAKAGEWWVQNGHRMLANNSWCATETPEVGQFMQEWLSLYQSKSGERGIFNRQASWDQCEKFGRAITWPNGDPIEFGTNPCSEIILRPNQGCNLSEVVAREEDSYEDLEEKVRIATVMGTLQATLTNFRYLRPRWKHMCEEERLLGVSMTGIMDCPLTNGSKPRKETAEMLEELRNYARKVNKEWAAELDINESAAITCVKPSGTVSQLVNSASGIHSRYAPYYIRRARQDNKDPLTQFMLSAGFPGEPDVMKPDQTTVFSFPMAAPESAVTRHDRTAVEELEHWKLFQDHWCEHKPSVTINVREKEWPEVGAWVWNNFDRISGISFLPSDDHTYRQAPYEEIDRDGYDALQKQMPDSVDWDGLQEYELEDNTTASKELACTAGVCEL